MNNDDKNKKEIIKLKEIVYYLLTLIIFYILFIIPYLLLEEGKKFEFWQSFLSGVGASIAASFFTQKMQDKTTQKTMLEKLSSELSVNMDNFFEKNYRF